MATTTALAQRIDRSLHAVLAEVEDLPTVLKEWDTLPDWNRASIRLDWAHLMADYMAELDHYARTKKMTVAQQAQYEEVLRKLTDAMPIIEQLNLFRPPVRLDG